MVLVPQQFTTLQEAIDGITGPATIVVSPGLYAQDIRIEQKPYLVIQSSRLGKRGVTLAGHQGRNIVSIERSVVHFSGVEFRSDGHSRGLHILDSSVTFQECVIAGNAASDRDEDGAGAGILARRSSVRIQKTSVIGNTLRASTDAAGGGLFFSGCKVEIAGCTIAANVAYAQLGARGGGIWCERSSMRMWRSRVTDNALHAGSCEGAGIYFRDCENVQLGGSVISGNGSVAGRGGGIFIDGDPAGIAIHRNTNLHQNHPDDCFVAS